MTLEELKAEVVKFRDNRDWKQFHDPKNLSEAISIEAGELLENFLWKTVEESRTKNKVKLEKIKEEVSDIVIYCLLLSEELNFNIIEEAKRKIKKNMKKYPPDKARGISKKYTDL